MIRLTDESATDAFGARLAHVLNRMTDGLVLALSGEVGAGKTTLTRAILRALGYSGPVVSPSYTLVEPYELPGRTLYHIDLYRIASPEELEFIGIREIDIQRDWVIVEWAERGAGHLPEVDVTLHISYAEPGRVVRLEPASDAGKCFLGELSATATSEVPDRAGPDPG